MASLAERIEAKIHRSRAHELWTGAVDARGVPVMKVGGRLTTVRRARWELAHGELSPTDRLQVTCNEVACVALRHLTLGGPAGPPAAPRRQRGSGSMRERSSGVWELAVTKGTDAKGRPMRAVRTFRGTSSDASRALAGLVVEIERDGVPEPSTRRGGPTVDDLIQQYWEYATEQGRAHSTLVNYRDVYKHWLLKPLGSMHAAAVGQRDLDRTFGAMRAAGLSHSTMNHAKVILSNAYKLGRRYRLINVQSPVAGYELPRSTRARRETIPPEVDELIQLLDVADRVCPEIAPALRLGATTGLRRGELCGLRRHRVNLDGLAITIDRTVNDAGGTVVVTDVTKTGKSRTLAIDAATAEMLRALFAQQDADAAAIGLTIAPDGYVFGLLGSHREPMRPEYMTRKMREVRAAMPGALSFDATILALRKFTTTELLDAGFNPSMVSSRQGHTTQTMLAHYGKRRRSADRAAADHLGNRLRAPLATEPPSGSDDA